MSRPLRSLLAAVVAALSALLAPAPAAVAADAPALAAGTARIHYHRPRGDYEGWGLHAWDGTPLAVQWTAPLPATGRTDFGVFWDVPLTPGAPRLGVIVHKGEQKDPGPDMFLDLAARREVWILSGRNDLAASRPDVSVLAFGDLSRQRAHWLDRTTLVWPGMPAGGRYRLHHSATAALRLAKGAPSGGESAELQVDPAGLPSELRARVPHLGNATVLRLAAADAARAETWLRGQLAVSMLAADGAQDATGVQVPHVLDALLADDGPLGVSWTAGVPTLRLWAPTAQRVRLLLFDGPRTPAAAQTLEMTRDGGAWRAAGGADWKDRYYLYEVTVFHPATGRIETVTVTDPWSRSLSRDSRRSQVVDLADPALAPAGWGRTPAPPLAAPEDAVLYELHIRDFSATVPGLPDGERGTYLAFTRDHSGTRHLKALAEAGVTHVHLLPTFDIATVAEDRTQWASPGDLAAFPADSDQQQAALQEVRGRDGFNWGYDPLHYGVPEGSYATQPDGGARLLEFRRMVQALHGMGLRVVMDVVYNHTHAAGLADPSVLDRIVPGYYHRLNLDGAVENSTCCANTASEHRMMRRLMVDDVVHWARHHRVDGFRFDLMGHHMRADMEAVRAALDALSPGRDGVEGRSILIYGEGWDFGEVQGGKRGPNATQRGLAGTGIGTFNDRLRDAVRGGSPFSDRREQGFASALGFLPGEFSRGGAGDLAKLVSHADRIRVGLAGNLAGYSFTDRSGARQTGAGVGGAGYTNDPQECINYVEAHDNETLWDKLLYALPLDTPLAARVRMNTLALSLPALAQGIPFFHAGGELLRTKSLDADSYDSGDWFNRVDWTRRTNFHGMGLPGAEKNRDRWPIIRERVARRALAPAPAQIEDAFEGFRDLLRIRRSTPLFRLRTADEVQARVGFLNTGPGQVPGLIVMTLSDAVAGRAPLGSPWARVLVVFNASPEPARYTYPGFAMTGMRLHPVQTAGRDPVVREARYDRATATVTVPGLTTAVFVSE
jgi:pullulanase